MAVTRARMCRAEAGGYEGSIVLVATLAVAVGDGRTGSFTASLGGGECEVAL